MTTKKRNKLMGKYDNKSHMQINFKVKISELEGVLFQTKVPNLIECIRNFSCRVHGIEKKLSPQWQFFLHNNPCDRDYR